MAHPEIVPGLKVRYRETAYLSLRGEVRIVTHVDDTGVDGVGVKLGEERYRTLVNGGNFRDRFWELFELVEDEPTEGDTQSDDGAAGVWVVWYEEAGIHIEVRGIFLDEVSALRSALSHTSSLVRTHRVTFVSYGSDVRDVIRATR